MTRILTTTALVLAMAAPAAAQYEMLREKVEMQLEASSLQVDVSALTDEQVRALYAGLSSEMSASGRNALIESIVSDSQFTMEDNMADFEGMDYGASNDLRETVGDMLMARGMEVDVNSLDSSQISALYLELTDGNGSDATEIEAIIQ